MVSESAWRAFAMRCNALRFDCTLRSAPYGLGLAYTPPIGAARQAKRKASLANEFWVGWASIAHRNVAEIGGGCRVGNKLPTLLGFVSIAPHGIGFISCIFLI